MVEKIKELAAKIFKNSDIKYKLSCIALKDPKYKDSVLIRIKVESDYNRDELMFAEGLSAELESYPFVILRAFDDNELHLRLADDFPDISESVIKSLRDSNTFFLRVDNKTLVDKVADAKLIGLLPFGYDTKLTVFTGKNNPSYVEFPGKVYESKEFLSIEEIAERLESLVPDLKVNILNSWTKEESDKDKLLVEDNHDRLVIKFETDKELTAEDVHNICNGFSDYLIVEVSGKGSIIIEEYSSITDDKTYGLDLYNKMNDKFLCSFVKNTIIRRDLHSDCKDAIYIPGILEYNSFNQDKIYYQVSDDYKSYPVHEYIAEILEESKQ